MRKSNWNRRNASWLGCALMAGLLLSSLPTGCASGSSAGKASLPVQSVLYQPPVLRLPAGQPVTTVDGTYTPQAAEVWHSDARFRQLEQENIDLAAALAALRK
jgi:hypothetical protein